MSAPNNLIISHTPATPHALSPTQGILPTIADEDLKPVLAWLTRRAKDFNGVDIDAMCNVTPNISSVIERIYNAVFQDGGYSGDADLSLHKLPAVVMPEALLTLVKRWDSAATAGQRRSLSLGGLDAAGIESTLSTLRSVTALRVEDIKSALTASTFASLIKTDAKMLKELVLIFDEDRVKECDQGKLELIPGLPPFEGLEELITNCGMNVPKILRDLKPSWDKLKLFWVEQRQTSDKAEYEDLSLMSNLTALENVEFVLRLDLNKIKPAEVSALSKGTPIVIPKLKFLTFTLRVTQHLTRETNLEYAHMSQPFSMPLLGR